MIEDKPLRIWFNNIYGFIRVYDGTRYLVLFGAEKYYFIYNWISYLIEVIRGIIYVISHNYAKIKAYRYNSLPLEKTLTLHDVVILVESVFNKDKNNH